MDGFQPKTTVDHHGLPKGASVLRHDVLWPCFMGRGLGRTADGGATGLALLPLTSQRRRGNGGRFSRRLWRRRLVLVGSGGDRSAFPPIGVVGNAGPRPRDSVARWAGPKAPSRKGVFSSMRRIGGAVGNAFARARRGVGASASSHGSVEYFPSFTLECVRSESPRCKRRGVVGEAGELIAGTRATRGGLGRGGHGSRGGQAWPRV